MIIQRQNNNKTRSMIDILWYVNEQDLEEERRKDIITPSGHIHMVFNFGDPCYLNVNEEKQLMPDSILVGQLKKAMHVCYGDNVKQVGLAFHPYSFYQLFHEVDSVYAEVMIDISHIDAFEELQSFVVKMMAAKGEDGHGVLDAIEDFFNRRYEIPEIPDYLEPVIMRINEENTIPSIDEMAQTSGYSISSFERHFKKDMGLSPKMYLDIIRFRRAMTEEDPERLFYDQSHYIKNVKKYTSKVPSVIEDATEISLLHMLGLEDK